LTSGGGNGAAAQKPASAPAANRPSVDRKEQKRIEAEQRQARSNRRKEQQQIVHRLEKEIQQLEARLKDLTAELESSATYEKPGRAVEINRELLHAQERLAELNPEWEAAAGKLAEIE
jgi:ATP-binding cassette subfamily F protein 3